MADCRRRFAFLLRLAAAGLLTMVSIAGGHADASSPPSMPLPAGVYQAAPCYRVTGLFAESGGIRFNTDPDPACPGIGFRSGATVSVSAVPQPGSTFAGWYGTFSGTANPLVFTITSDVSVSANFQSGSLQGTPRLSITPAVRDYGTSAVTNSFNVNNTGGGVLDWSVSTAGVPPWVNVVGPLSGTGSRFIVDVNRTGLALGTYTASLTVNSNGGSQVVTVTMTVLGADGQPPPTPSPAAPSAATPSPTTPSPATPPSIVPPPATKVSLALSSSATAAPPGVAVTLTATVTEGIDLARQNFAVIGIRMEDAEGEVPDWCEGSPSAAGNLTCSIRVNSPVRERHTYMARLIGSNHRDALTDRFMLIDFREIARSSPVTVDWTTSVCVPVVIVASGGSVVLGGPANRPCAAGTAQPGSTSSLRAQPRAGFVFSRWEVAGGTVDCAACAETTLTIPSGATATARVTGVFETAPAVPAAPTPAPATGVAFSQPPAFSPSGQAAAVFPGGAVDQLEAAAAAAKAAGVWVQDALGLFQLLIVNGPASLKAQFQERFPGGFGSATPVVLTR